MYGRIPYTYEIETVTPKELIFEFDDDSPQDPDSGEENKTIDIKKTVKNIIAEYPNAIVYNADVEKCISRVMLFHDDFIYSDGTLYLDSDTLPERLKKCIVAMEKKPMVRWVVRNQNGGIDSMRMDILPKGDLESNYNDDLLPVHDKIVRLIHSDESSIIILHGKPGTGKTSYIRNLIATNTDIKFYWLDSNMFMYLDSSNFIKFLISCQNAVFILEDSESLLKSREETKNPAMQSLLNISDGMLGDSLKLKFICTFNTNVRNIDHAILRKGRMKLKYEFKDLNIEKVKALFRKQGMDESLATKDMPLCDIYNFLDDNGNDQTINRIGF
jgi:hypothetical protein